MSDNKKQLYKGAILSYLLIAVQFIAGLLYTPVILHQLGAQKYGVYSLCTSFTGYLTIFNAAVNAAYVRFYVQAKTRGDREIPKINGLFSKIFILLAIIAFGVGLMLDFFAEYILGNKITATEYRTIHNCFFLLSFNVAIAILNCIYSSLIVAHEEFIFAKTISLINVILNLIIIIPLLYHGYGIEIIIFVQAVTSFIALSANKIFCKKFLKEEFDLRSKDDTLLKEVLIFSGFIVIQSIMDQLNWQIDKFILARTRGTVEVSLYSVGSQFLTYYITISSAMSGIFIAEINRRVSVKGDTEVNILFLNTSRIFAIIVFYIMIAFIIFGKPFISLWAGEEHLSSYYVALLLMLPVTVSLTQGTGQDIVRAKNKHAVLTLINCSVCILNVCVSIPLAIRFGAFGSAFGTFLTEIIICIIIKNIYYYKVINLDIKRYFYEMLYIIRGLIIPIIFGSLLIGFRIVQFTYFSLVYWGMCFTILYFLSTWFFVANENERNVLRNTMAKIHVKKRTI